MGHTSPGITLKPEYGQGYYQVQTEAHENTEPNAT